MKGSSKMTRQELIGKICEASFNGCLGLFVGAGFTKAALKGSADYEAYSWKELLRECCKEMDVDKSIVESPVSNPEIASMICESFMQKDSSKMINYGKAVEKLKQIIADKVSVYPKENVRVAFTKYFDELNVSWVITTNYDTIIENFLEGKALSIGPDDFFLKKEGLVPVYHIHGLRYSPQSIVITNEDYARYFRPNDYRPARLPFLIKESLVLMVGYGFGDINVLTAVDFAKNVYNANSVEPFPVIQLVYKEDEYKKEPYLHQPSGIWVVEIKDIPSFFEEIIAEKDTAKRKRRKLENKLKRWCRVFDSPSQGILDAFIKNERGRNGCIGFLNVMDREYNSVFLHFEYFCKKVFDRCKEMEEPNKAFEAYNDHLKVFLSLFEISVQNMPDSFFAFLASEFDSVAYFINDEHYGASWSAGKTWKSKCSNIPKELILRLKQYDAGKGGFYTNLRRLLNMIV